MARRKLTTLSAIPRARIPRGTTSLAFAGLLLLLGLAGGCSPRRYAAAADRDVAKLIARRSALVPNMDGQFTIETNPAPVLDDLPAAGAPAGFLGAYGEAERGAHVVSLDAALQLAVRHSREYQNRKELLYLAALDVTLVRRRHNPIAFGTGRADYQVTTEEVQVGVDAITGEPTTVLSQDTRLLEEQRLSASGSVGLSWLLATGARLSTAFTTDFLRYLTGDPRTFSQSQLVGQLSQPLLRGGGRAVTMEDLTQAERNLLYALREFTQYRKEFAVDVASSYFSVLRNRDATVNAWNDLGRSQKNAERERAFAAEGLRPSASVDQLEQNALTSETGWIEAVRTYRETLDRFKIQLGLPVAARLILDDRDLQALRIEELGLTVDQALQVAVVTRLDLQTRRDLVDDTDRKIRVAANQLLPRLDVVAAGSVSGASSSGFAVPDFERYRWNAGLDVDLPFDRRAERNAYRTALIARNRASREWDLAVDNVKLQIADDARELEQARRNYANAEIGVRLGERRVEEQTLLAELGRGTTRALLDAQADLLNARNQRTGALVNHVLARLRFWRDMGILYLKESGQWEELQATVRKVQRTGSGPTPTPTPAAAPPLTNEPATKSP